MLYGTGLALNTEDEDDINYAPEGEFFTGDSYGYAARKYATRASWAFGVKEGNIKLKPPPWWLEEQDALGRRAAKYNIWYFRYTQARRISIWVMAPLSDFRRAGYLRKAA